MAKVFISSTREDFVSNYRHILEDELSSRGHEIFEANTGNVGTSFRNEILKNLLEADAFILLLSNDSINNKWVNWETNSVITLTSERAKPAFFPVVIEDIQIEKIPEKIINYAYLKEGDPRRAAERLDEALTKVQTEKIVKEEKQKEVHIKVKRSAGEYIKSSLSELQLREKNYRRLAYFWYGVGFVSLISGVAFAFWRASHLPVPKDGWAEYFAFLTLVIVVIGFLGAIARFSFVLGKSFVVESLRNSDRIHAIRFGEFYLNAFAETADWSEVKEAFQHWNIDSGSAFVSQNPSDVDPQILKTAKEIAGIFKNSA